jgi:hypothetical protein
MLSSALVAALLLAGGAEAFSYAPAALLRSHRVAAPVAAPLPRLGDAPRTATGTARVRRRATCGLGVRAMAGEVVDNVAVVLLAGGVGSRMKAGKPKQFLELEGKTILRTSLDIFLGLKGVTSISVVLAEEYRDQLADVAAVDSRACTLCHSWLCDFRQLLRV